MSLASARCSTCLVTLSCPRPPHSSQTMASGPRTLDRVSHRREAITPSSIGPNLRAAVGLALRDVVGAECVWRKVERGERTIIPARLSAPPRRLKSHRDFVWPTAPRAVALD